MSTAVEARGLSKSYGSNVALDGLTFALQAGELVGVLGPNGAGKTTAIRILTTILVPDQGSFSVAGIPDTQPSKIRELIGVLPESSGYPQRLRAEEYLQFHARVYGQSRASARAVSRALLSEVGLAEQGRSLIASYSRGMRQRLGIARALVNRPAVVFLDEPTLGLDPAGQRDILAMVRALAADRGTAVLLCTHLLEEVEENCSRVLILNRAHLVAEGTVSEVVTQSAAPRRARIRVAPEHLQLAVETLRRSMTIQEVVSDEVADGTLAVVLAEPRAGSADAALNTVIRPLLDAGVPLLACELERARLSDAFLSMTAAGPE